MLVLLVLYVEMLLPPLFVFVVPLSLEEVPLLLELPLPELPPLLPPPELLLPDTALAKELNKE